MIRIFTILILSVALSATVQANKLQCQAAVKGLGELKSMSPQVRLQKSLKKNDYRFLGIYGRVLIVPGVENFYRCYATRFGALVLPGTSDKPSCKQQRLYTQKAHQYATQYNSILVAHLKNNKGVVCETDDEL